MSKWNPIPEIENCTIAVRSCVYKLVPGERREKTTHFNDFHQVPQNSRKNMVLRIINKFSWAHLCEGSVSKLRKYSISKNVHLYVYVSELKQKKKLNMFIHILKPSRWVSSVKVWAAGDWEWKAQFVSWQRPDPSACPWTRPQQAHTHIVFTYTNILYTYTIHISSFFIHFH